MSGSGTAGTWAGRRVLVTGHTGFKGSWLTLWLTELGARVNGLALDPPTAPSLYDDAGIGDLVDVDIRGDVSDPAVVRNAIAEVVPDVVFHLAAQSIVLTSYADPSATFATNVMGTVHVLDALRRVGRPCVAVVVTSDKVYADGGPPGGNREHDRLGGADPYSASKASAELVAACFRRSYGDVGGLRIATVRAGNVIGGGDWARYRLVPDAIHAWVHGQPVRLRRPGATRPWQHVLEPLSGYLRLAERLSVPSAPRLPAAWNFGPADSGVTAASLIERVAERWAAVEGAAVPAGGWQPAPGAEWHEAAALTLDSSQARRELGWSPRWDLDTALGRVARWYRGWLADRGRARALCLDDLAAYATASAAQQEPVAFPFS